MIRKSMAVRKRTNSLRNSFFSNPWLPKRRAMGDPMHLRCGAYGRELIIVGAIEPKNNHDPQAGIMPKR